MRKILALPCFMAISFLTFAQKDKSSDPNLPAFGAVSKEDLQMKNCSFDDKAEAMVLVDDGVMEYISGDGMQLKRRVRIKILNNEGLENANIHLSYLSYKGNQDITGLEAVTYNLDASGNIVKTSLDKKLVYEKKIDKRYTEKTFTFPEVKVGSIIEYKYKKKGMGLMDWYFQRSIPVRYSHFSIELPSDIELAAIPYVSHKYESDKKYSSNSTIRTYSMSNVPAFRYEPYILNEDFYLDRLETKITSYTGANGLRENQVINWIQVVKYLMEDEDFGTQIKKNIPRTADLDEKLKNITSPYEKMKIIYKYVQSNMVWNEYKGIWALDGVKSAWKDKKGTLGEINLILVNLLKDADLPAHPILVSSRDNGVVNPLDAGTYDYPGFYQFDKVMAYVEIDKHKYVLDATQKNTPAHLIPADVLATQGLVISKYETFEWGWTNLYENNLKAKNVVLINGAIDDKGKLAGNISVSSYDYERLARLNTAKKGKDKFIEKYATESNAGLTVEDLSFENLESDSLPLVQNFKFSQALNAAGDYQYFSTNILTGLEKNPFVADMRFSDVFFGCGQSYMIIGNFTLPEGYEFDQRPKNIKMIMQDTSIVASRLSQVTDNMLQLRIQVDFKKPVYSVKQYAELQEFYKSLFDMLNEQFVIRKKKQ